MCCGPATGSGRNVALHCAGPAPSAHAPHVVWAYGMGAPCRTRGSTLGHHWSCYMHVCTCTGHAHVPKPNVEGCVMPGGGAGGRCRGARTAVDAVGR